MKNDDKWGKLHPITEEEYLNHGIMPGSNPYKDRKKQKTFSLDIGERLKELLKENEIMSEPTEKLCLKTLSKSYNAVSELISMIPEDNPDEYNRGKHTMGLMMIIAIQGTVIKQEVPEFEFAKESESD